MIGDVQSALEVVRWGLEQKLVSGKGKPVVVRAWPGSRREDWRFSVTPPGAVGELLEFCSGLEFMVSRWSGLLIAEIDFTGRSFLAAFELDLMPGALPIAGDGCGNFWVVDMAGTWGPIYFCYHDAPVVLCRPNH